LPGERIAIRQPRSPQKRNALGHVGRRAQFALDFLAFRRRQFASRISSDFINKAELCFR
jgi:hypothetical protein